MSDGEITLQQLRDATAAFVRERDWDQFHAPKNLSMAIAIEAAELMEHFQWLTVEASKTPAVEELEEVGEELADIVIYALSMANVLAIDLSDTVLTKLEKNRRKYPKERACGKAHKYTWYQGAEKERGED